MKKSIPPKGEIDSVRRVRRVKFGYRVSITVRVLNPDDFDADEAVIVALLHLSDNLRERGYDVARMVAEGPRGTTREE